MNLRRKDTFYVQVRKEYNQLTMYQQLDDTFPFRVKFQVLCTKE